jgi:ATP/maltotriose-dependent transcriptional regulator MalT
LRGFQGDTEKSNRLLKQAVKLLDQQKDAEGEAEALHSLASIARRKGDCTQSLKLLEQAEKLVDENSKFL